MDANRELELWAGVECTINRVGDCWRDQLERNGHYQRPADIDLFADLGVKAIRYPVLWERMAAGGEAAWKAVEGRLPQLRQRGVEPIAGLVHHGSGPAHTSLVSDNFATGLAEHAAAVARRFPWLARYTPVNEPLTTARFSGLYGHWYPHGRDDRTFVRCLLNQCRATILAMQAIRRVNPAAELVQTENLERVHSTPKLRYQAEFENQRRWLATDLLMGRVNRGHELWRYLTEHGASVNELTWFQDFAEPPAVLGWNYYLTSERLLDQRTSRYPRGYHGGNGFDSYADVEAVRARGEGIAGLATLLREAWDRYGRPLAVTEVHLGCERESQLRWLVDAWRQCQELRHGGVDVRAVTVWSLLGSFDWNSLCTRGDGLYEPGVFDVRSGEPRPTALAALVKSIAAGEPAPHPAIPDAGWWTRAERLGYTPVYTSRRRSSAILASPAPNAIQNASRPLLIAGARGTLGVAFQKICRRRSLSRVALNRPELDIADPHSVTLAIERYRPWGIVNAAGYVRVDDAEQDIDACHRANVVGPLTLAAVCRRYGVQLLTFSSDLVFDGGRSEPYLERDGVRPLSVYGVTKAEAERRVLHVFPEAIVVRTSAFFGPWDHHNFLTVALKRLQLGKKLLAAEDWIVSPTYLPDLIGACLDLLIDREQGLWHLANQGSLSWAEFAVMGAMEAGLDRGLIRGCLGVELGLLARRPSYSALGSEKGLLLPPLGDSVCRYWRRMCDESPGLAGAV